MSPHLEPFFSASLAVQLHLSVAVGAFLLGLWVFNRPKGGPAHRWLGRIWMGGMATIAVSSLFIPAGLFRMVGPFGPIHLLSLWVLVAIAKAIQAARQGRIEAHRRWLRGLYLGALVGAGAGALVPGRLISRMVGYHTPAPVTSSVDAPQR
jgi:uncharacterized membrane protein